MKSIKLMAFLCLFFYGVNTSAQQNEMKNIESLITKFSKAGDNSDATKLDACLDENYRVVMNRLFGSTVVGVMDKSTYLEKIKTKEFGGDKRKVIIENIVINGSTAIAKVKFVGEKMTFVSILNLITDGNGHWKLISDTPMVL